MHGLLLDVGKDVKNPSTRLALVGSEVRIAGPTICPAVRRKPAGSAFVLQAAQSELLKVVSALPDPRRFRAACTAGSKSAVRMPMIVMTTKSSTRVNPRWKHKSCRGRLSRSHGSDPRLAMRVLETTTTGRNRQHHTALF